MEGHILLSMKTNCEDCNGRGRKEYWKYVVKKDESHIYWARCDKCEGSGKVEKKEEDKDNEQTKSN